MIKYIGSKRALLPWILSVVDAVDDVKPVTSAIDLFSGAARVTHALKTRGLRVLANDHNAYAHTLAACYAQADAESVLDDARAAIDHLNTVPAQPGWFTDAYAHQSRYFTPANAARIEGVRNAIAAMRARPELESVLLTSLLQGADRVDSTTGLQMAYLKQLAPRAHKPLTLTLPDVLPRSPHGAGEAHNLDALDAVEILEADIAYLDPPYNRHSYLSNYHVWETLVRWDRPALYGVARKRADCRTRKSAFNSAANRTDALARVVQRVRAHTVIVSCNDESPVSPAQIEAMLAPRGGAITLSRPHARYVGARIGIYNPKGERVGAVGRLRNTEHLVIASEHGAVIDRLRPLCQHPVPAA